MSIQIQFSLDYRLRHYLLQESHTLKPILEDQAVEIIISKSYKFGLLAWTCIGLGIFFGNLFSLTLAYYESFSDAENSTQSPAARTEDNIHRVRAICYSHFMSESEMYMKLLGLIVSDG